MCVVCCCWGSVSGVGCCWLGVVCVGHAAHTTAGSQAEETTTTRRGGGGVLLSTYSFFRKTNPPGNYGILLRKRRWDPTYPSPLIPSPPVPPPPLLLLLFFLLSLSSLSLSPSSPSSPGLRLSSGCVILPKFPKCYLMVIYLARNGHFPVISCKNTGKIAKMNIKFLFPGYLYVFF